MYIIDLASNLKCIVKLFADDTVFFTVGQKPNAATYDMNHDLRLINQWTYDWSMSFNPDLQEHAVELLLSRRHDKEHPVLFLNNVPVGKVNYPEYLVPS